eukprot:RCo044003
MGGGDGGCSEVGRDSGMLQPGKVGCWWSLSWFPCMCIFSLSSSCALSLLLSLSHSFSLCSLCALCVSIGAVGLLGCSVLMQKPEVWHSRLCMSFCVIFQAKKK